MCTRSQWARVAVDALPQFRPDPPVARDIDLAPENLLKLLRQCGGIEQAGPGFPGNQKVDIAVGPLGATRHRTDEANTRRAMTLCEGFNLAAFFTQQFPDAHVHHSARWQAEHARRIAPQLECKV